MNLSFVPLSITGSDSVIKWLVNPHLPALINLHGFFLKKIFIWKAEQCKRDRRKDLSVIGLFLAWQWWLGLSQVDAGNQQLHLDLPFRKQGPKYLDILCCLSRCKSREGEWTQRASTRIWAVIRYVCATVPTLSASSLTCVFAAAHLEISLENHNHWDECLSPSYY